MGLSASMWSSVSGLLTHGEKMNVIGNNIANVSTIGFKGQRMDFQDFIYQDSFSAGGNVQIGRGVGVNALLGDFSQGAFETTNDPMDMGIGGKGYFQVKDKYSDQVWYTRAGNFRFDKEGRLTNPQGYTLQGWKIDNRDGPTIATGSAPSVNKTSAIQGSGVPTDIVLDAWNVPPKQTTKVQLSLNLSAASGNDKTNNALNPFFALSERWNGKQPPNPEDGPPLSSDAYSYQTSLKVYDEGGTSHTLTTYFDQVSSDHVKNLPPGYKVYEYFTTMDPAEDVRTYGGKYDATTSTMVDDPSTVCAGKSVSAASMFADNTKRPTGTAYTKNATGDYNAAVAAVNAALGLTGPDVLTDVGIIQLPSGRWSLDPNDPNVAKALKVDPNPLSPNWVDMKTVNEGAAGDPDYDADINKVKKFSETKAAGIVMKGTMTFNAAGQLVNQTAYSFMGNTEYDSPIKDANGKVIGYNMPNNDPTDPTSWQPTAVSNNGIPVFTANFTGQPLANSVRQKTADGTRDAQNYLIELDFGFKCVGSLTDPWGIGGPVSAGTRTASIRDAMVLDVDPTDPNTRPDYQKLSNMGKNGQKQSNAISNVGDNNNTLMASQNGYASGSLTSTTVDQDGVLYGVYSNGVTLPLYQLTLYDFVDPQGLRREGGNLFSATMKSGNPQIGAARQGGMGSINSYSIEQSNVDMAREFVQMITTQRGFQANSKGITTVDQMLEQVIQMKR